MAKVTETPTLTTTNHLILKLFLNSGFLGLLTIESQLQNTVRVRNSIHVIASLFFQSKTFDNLNLKWLYLVGILQVLRFEFHKFRNLGPR